MPEITFRVDADKKSIIEISKPTGDNIKYWIKCLKDGTETEVAGYSDWQKESQFSNIPFGDFYYFYAKKCADRDHLESTPSRSEAYLADGNNIICLLYTSIKLKLQTLLITLK